MIVALLLSGLALAERVTAQSPPTVSSTEHRSPEQRS